MGESGAEHAARLIEEQIRRNPFESAYAFDASGRLVLSKVGGADSLEFTATELARLKDTVLTHNPPADVSLSRSDVDLATFAQVAEIRVVTPRWRYVLTRPGPGWDTAYFEMTVGPRFDHHARIVRVELLRAVRTRRITPAEAETRFLDEVWTGVARELGLEYRREA